MYRTTTETKRERAAEVSLVMNDARSSHFIIVDCTITLPSVAARRVTTPLRAKDNICRFQHQDVK